MPSFELDVLGKIAMAVTVTVGYVVAVQIMSPYQKIEARFIVIQKEWDESAASQSIRDRFNQNKLTRAQWLEAKHNGPAKLLWAELSTSFPDHQSHIAKKIKTAYPHATKWV